MRQTPSYMISCSFYTTGGVPLHQNGTECIDYLGKCLLRAPEEEGLCVVENTQELVAEPQQPTSFLATTPAVSI